MDREERDVKAGLIEETQRKDATRGKASPLRLTPARKQVQQQKSTGDTAVSTVLVCTTLGLVVFI